MALSFKIGFAETMTHAAGSTMTARLSCTRPWLRLAAFIPISVLSILAPMVALVVIGMFVPGLDDRMAALGNQLNDNPLRLVEESIRTLIFAVAMGLVSISFLAAACLTWRAPLGQFLWPGRRFDLQLFGVGILLMTAIQILWIPFTLRMGGEWRPPVFDPYYVGHTRILYAAAMTGALLIAAAAEEVIFRGVVLRVSGLITRRALVLCLMNGLMFSAIHLDPDPVSFLQRTLAGMGWTWAALRVGGLEFAIGSHFANNLFLALIWSPMSTVTQAQEVSWVVLAPELATIAIVVTVVEVLARRRAGAGPSPVVPSAA
ncbi:CPBP family intramembrane metalloprotease [Brevundimonas naejangsanensis]|uniref:CPBP family intramembrane metalloprotease n=1 Tax=Brevundimonas naejangsanensis TaxID=588932 RepID=A0A494RIZ7_9CAUL|nr:CPBP family intramembrane glutamic endopeptidase [Brevundimonas naejangsanensis]AYG95013.1 CPBP family intramembrane metalloprotease [Brevundimonas naejangsanensis]